MPDDLRNGLLGRQGRKVTGSIFCCPLSGATLATTLVPGPLGVLNKEHCSPGAAHTGRVFGWLPPRLLQVEPRWGQAARKGDSFWYGYCHGHTPTAIFRQPRFVLQPLHAAPSPRSCMCHSSINSSLHKTVPGRLDLRHLMLQGGVSTAVVAISPLRALDKLRRVVEAAMRDSKVYSRMP
jgi:hypothetical protein